MDDPAGLPAYGTAPPPPGPPPPRGTPPWVWFLVGGVVLVAGSLTILFVIGVVLSISSPGGSSGPEDDGFYFVEQDSVMSATRATCADLQDSAAELGPIGTPQQAAARLTAVSADMRSVASAIESADPDPDALAWRDDWLVLADSVQRFAATLETDPEARFTMPVSRGVRVSERMYTGSYECFVPVGVVALDPSPESDQYFSD